jgi:DNA-directed RNA polymerase specialized sigma24 family protein
MPTLTDKVLHYQATHAGLQAILDEVSPRIYDFPRRTLPYDEDASGDFYLFFHPRLLHLLDRFKDQGKPFEAYLHSVLTWQFKNFLRTRRQAERQWNTTLRLDPGEGYALPDTAQSEETTTGTLADVTGTSRLLRSKADRRNFTLLLLKQPTPIDAKIAPIMAKLTGQPPERLFALAETLKASREPGETRLDVLRARRNKAFAQTRLLEADLYGEIDPHRRETLMGNLARTKRRMSNTVDRMSRVALAPTNREIAITLGIPKGTVDSGLYWLKRKLTQGTSSGIETA